MRLLGAASLPFAAFAAAILATPLFAQAAPKPTDVTALGDEAVQLTKEYLRINTSNPPGNEIEAVRFFARIFAKEGIVFDTASAAPGRANIWARLKATTSTGPAKPALVLLHHTDVVPSDPKYWTADPFASSEKNGNIIGRGALDTKALGIAQLMAFLALHRERTPLDRDVIFIATADEEAGGNFGAGWLVKNRPDAFRGAGLLLNEGGDGTRYDDGRQFFSIEVTQKVPYWLKLTAVGKPGHGSTPPPASSVNRLIRALERLQTHEFAPRVVPAVGAFLAAIAPTAGERWSDLYAHPQQLIADRNLLLQLQIERPAMAGLLRNTCSITMLSASNKVNVVPPEASAQVDCRMLPDQDRAAFRREFESALNDPSIKIEEIIAFTAAVSGTDTPLYTAAVDVLKRNFPQASIAPAVMTGFTDSHWFRDLGVASYGFSPFLIPEAEEGGVHGNDEQISVENVRRGARIMLELVRQVSATKAKM